MPLEILELPKASTPNQKATMHVVLFYCLEMPKAAISFQALHQAPLQRSQCQYHYQNTLSIPPGEGKKYKEGP